MSWLDNHFIDGNIYHIESDGQYIVADFWQPSSYAYAKITFIKCGNVKINGTNVNVSGTHDARIIIRIGYEIGMLPRMYLDFVVENNGQLLHYTDFYNNESFSFDGVYDATQSEVIGNGTITDYDYPFSKFIEGIEQVESDNIVSLRLCSYKGEKHLVTKDTTAYMKNNIYVYGQLTEECDVLNPSFLIQYDDVPALNVQRTAVSPYNPLLKYNYLFVDKFKRSYFINKITSVRKGLWRIDCHVDVLNTYDSDIRKQKSFVTRNENVSANDLLFDDRIPYDDIPMIDYKNVTTASPSLVNATFDFSDVTSGYKFVAKIFDNLTKVTNPTDITSPNSGLPNVPNLYKEESTLNIMDFSSMYSIVMANAENDVATSYISSMLYLPIDLHTLYGQSGSPSSNIYAGKYVLSDGDWKETPYTGTVYPKTYRIEQSNSPYLIIADFNEIGAEPFTSTIYAGAGKSINCHKVHYELYIPFVGYVELNYRDIHNDRLQIMYNIDFDTGRGTAMVYNYSQSKMLYTKDCQIGYQLPINTTNALEITKQKENNNINLVLSLFSSAVATKLGSKQSSALGGIGGIVGGVRSVASFVNANNLMFERAQTSFGGNNGMFYLPIKKPHWKITSHNILINDFDEFYHLNGKPYNKDSLLSLLTGYTEIETLHYKPDTQTWITTTEISEIEELAKNGIIL